MAFTNRERAKQARRTRRAHRVRARIQGTAARPRLAVHRTLKHMRAQLIDDQSGKTLVSAGDHELTGKKVSAKGGSASGGKGKTAAAAAVGTLISEKAKKVGITQVVFDRRAYRYHGRVQALAEAARAGGLQF